MTVIAVAGLSARVLAEAAADDGFQVIALDVFGDADTRRAAVEWRAIGSAASLRIDAAALLAALRALAARGDVAGWIAGSGFDGAQHLIAHGARLLPLFGTAACDQRRLRDPATFFAALRGHAIPYPPSRVDPPPDPDGWLLKDAHGSGGSHIRDAAALAASHGGQVPAVERSSACYFQRRSAGLPMSATFIGNGERAVVLGINRSWVEPIGDRPFVFAGIVGPVLVAAAVQAQVERALQPLAAGFRLRGLGSLDFLLDGDTVEVLEINARPPASLALYRGRVAGGLLAAHVRACRDGVLPLAWRAEDGELADADAGVGDAEGGVGGADGGVEGADGAGCAGHRIVFTRAPLALGTAAAEAVAAAPDVHDLPSAGSVLAAGVPLCTLSATRSGRCEHDVTVLMDTLQGRHDELLARLAALSDGSTEDARKHLLETSP